jgi:hypothetical protein
MSSSSLLPNPTKLNSLLILIGAMAITVGSLSIIDYLYIKDIKQCMPEQTTTGAFTMSCSTVTSGSLVMTGTKTDFQCNQDYVKKYSLGVIITGVVIAFIFIVLGALYGGTNIRLSSGILKFILFVTLIATSANLVLSYFLSNKDCYDKQYAIHSSLQSIDVGILLSILIYWFVGGLENYEQTFLLQSSTSYT